ncbi:MAG: T9SS type A sorting domain-containing protein, partial [Candidatus Cloacimonetes bacterium]|nr:T9SS type A sorting domain-containing protein [Candidatus Cloacimonadota bacterium]
CCTQPIRNVHLARVGTPLTSVEASDVLPQRLELRSWPNPFNPSTRLAFQLDRPGQVTLQVYNLQGRLVATLLQDSALGAGTHSMTWEADSRLASGTYLLQLAVGEQSTTRKVLLLR